MGEVKDSGKKGHSCRRKPRGEERGGRFHGRDAQMSLEERSKAASSRRECVSLGARKVRLPRFPFLNIEAGQEAAHEIQPPPTPPGGLYLRGTITVLQRESHIGRQDPEIVGYYKFNTQTVFAKSHQHLSQEINKKY